MQQKKKSLYLFICLYSSVPRLHIELRNQPQKSDEGLNLLSEDLIAEKLKVESVHLKNEFSDSKKVYSFL